MTNAIKELSRYNTETIKKALERVNGSEEAKARALKLIEDDKRMRKEIARMFGK
jgi:hypothetical protein